MPLCDNFDNEEEYMFTAYSYIGKSDNIEYVSEEEAIEANKSN